MCIRDRSRDGRRRMQRELLRYEEAIEIERLVGQREQHHGERASDDRRERDTIGRRARGHVRRDLLTMHVIDREDRVCCHCAPPNAGRRFDGKIRAGVTYPRSRVPRLAALSNLTLRSMPGTVLRALTAVAIVLP